MLGELHCPKQSAKFYAKHQLGSSNAKTNFDFTTSNLLDRVNHQNGKVRLRNLW